MKKIIACIFCAVLGFATVITAADPSDYLLEMPKLTDAQKAAFSTTDGQISAFWDSWGANDYIEMTTGNNSYPGRAPWDGPDDAGITIKAAVTVNGLYFYMNIKDNVWVDASGGSDNWKMDAVDVFFDAQSSDEINACQPDCLVNAAYNWALSFTSQQIQMWMGASALPTMFKFNFYDPLYFDWSYNTTSFDNAKTLYNGMHMEVVQVDATHKAQEWFVPWQNFGDVQNGVSGDLSGKKFAFTAGYNDMDGDGGDVGCLRWKKSDPFASVTAGHDPFGSWGNMQMPADLGSAQTGIVSRGARDGITASENVVSTQFFNLRGERIDIAAARRLSGNAFFVKRLLFKDGSVKNIKVRSINVR